MTNRFAWIIGALFTLSALSPAFASTYHDGKLRLDLSTCYPDGMISSLQEKSDPRHFWINQVVAIDSDIQAIRNRGMPEACSDDSDSLKCSTYYRNLLTSLYNCKKTARLMCQKNGACQ